MFQRPSADIARPSCWGGDPRRRGATALEFALTLPLLLTFILGCVDFGRFAYSYIAVTNAARAGAGYGSAHTYTPATLSTWQAAVRQSVLDEISQMSGFDPNNLSVTATPVTEGSGQWRAQVDVSYPFQTLVTWPYIPHSFSLERVVAMRATR